MLESKMLHLNLSETEKELIKQDIMHKEEKFYYDKVRIDAIRC